MTATRRGEAIVDGVRSPTLEAGPEGATEAAVFVHGRNGDVEQAAALVAEIAEAEPLWLPAFERYEALGLLPEGVVARARR